MNKAKCSAAGKALAECRWGKKKAAKPKSKPRPKSAAPARRSRRLAGKTAETMRQSEPKKKPPRKVPKKKAPKRSVASKKTENILVPGLNPPRGDMRRFIERQRRLYD